MDTDDFPTDPRALTLPQRRSNQSRMHREQRFWLERLRQLAEGPPPEKDFPAFLLATAAFRELAQHLARATTRAQLPPQVADEMDRFVQAFSDYLRTCDGEDSFASRRQPRG
ncbi:MAG TPA: hypothetical protein VFD82_08455 [Planctomycetota bacterium]|nr:hypothetical protein [Planctomycetota bacterium]